MGKCDVCHPAPPPPSFPSVNSRIQTVHRPRAPQRTGPRPLPTTENPSNWAQEMCAKCQAGLYLDPWGPGFPRSCVCLMRLFNEALWCGQWFGKLAKYKIQTKQEDKPAQLEGYCPRNSTSTLQGAHSQLALRRNNSGHQGTWTNAPVSKWSTQGGKIQTQVNVILISLPGF